MELNQYIEHTALKANVLQSDIKTLCKEAIDNKFVGVCVPPYFVQKAAALLADSDVKVVTVVGFPLGYQTTPVKVEEAKKALDDGATELDMVINIAAFKQGEYNYVLNDIRSLTTLCSMKDAVLKVIIETAYLSPEEIVKACEICIEAEANYVKTSTGFAPSGAKVEDITLMRKTLPANINIKASGGIKTKAQAIDLINAGATRIGASAGVSIISE